MDKEEANQISCGTAQQTKVINYNMRNPSPWLSLDVVVQWIRLAGN